MRIGIDPDDRASEGVDTIGFAGITQRGYDHACVLPATVSYSATALSTSTPRPEGPAPFGADGTEHAAFHGQSALFRFRAQQLRHRNEQIVMMLGQNVPDRIFSGAAGTCEADDIHAAPT